MYCDFCREPRPAWNYPCVDYTLPDGKSRSTGAWAACEVCHGLIEADARVALARRSAASFLARHGIAPPLEAFVETQAGFFTHRTGPGERLAAGN
jgi:hypothetical protein